MLPDKRTALCLFLATSEGYLAFGKQHVMDVADYMQEVTNTLPDDLKPLGELLSKILIQVLTNSFTESLALFTERGLREIARAGQDSQGGTPDGCPSQQEAVENNWRE
jgi:hypothetical protein